MNIDNLEDLIISKKKVKYQYKNIDFMIDIKNVDNLIIMFHAINYSKDIIFRGFNYNFDNATVLSIADPLDKYYKHTSNFFLGWYIETDNCKFRDNIIELISYLKNIYQYKKIIFVGQCAGAIIACNLASHFKETFVFTNPHLILDKKVFTWQWHETCTKNGYLIDSSTQKYKKKNGYKIPTLIKTLNENNDKILDPYFSDVRNFTPPKKIYGYVHKKDYTYEHVNLYIEYLKGLNFKHNIVIHETKAEKSHHCYFPIGLNMKKFLTNIMKE